MNLVQPLQIYRVLKDHSVNFVIIGGHAVNFHGYIRSTEDSDIVFLRYDENEKNLLSALDALGAYWISDELDPATGIEKIIPVSASYLNSHSLMLLGTGLGYLDIFDFIPGFRDVPTSELFASCEEEGNLKFASLDWLIKMKQKAGRHKDLADLENLTLNEKKQS